MFQGDYFRKIAEKKFAGRKNIQYSKVENDEGKTRIEMAQCAKTSKIVQYLIFLNK